MNRSKTQLNLWLWLGISAFAVSGCGINNLPPDAPANSLTSGSSVSSQAASSFSLYASAESVLPGGSVQLTANGGVEPYTYVNPSGVGTLNSSTGAYIAPSYDATVSLEAIDSQGDTSYMSLTISTTASASSSTTGGTLSVTASSNTILPGGQVTFTVTGGTPPYNYYIASGNGTLSVNGSSYSDSTVYTATTYDVQTIELQVLDSSSPQQQAYETVTNSSSADVEPMTIQTNMYPTCGNTPCYLNPDYATAAEVCIINGYTELVDFTLVSQYATQPNEPSGYYTGNRSWWNGVGWSSAWDGQCNTGGGCSGPGYLIGSVTCQ